MPWRHPRPKAFPGDGDARRRDPLLPGLTRPELRAAPARSSWGLRVSADGAGWWQASDCESWYSEPAVGAWGLSPRLPTLPAVAPRAAQQRAARRAEPQPREPALPRLRPGESGKARRGSATEARDSLGALLGEFLPSRFREFLSHLGAGCAELPNVETESVGHRTRKTPVRTVPQRRPTTVSASTWLPEFSAPRHQRGVSEYDWPSQCPSCSFLPDLGGQPHFQSSLKKILHHQTPALGPLRKSQFSTFRNAKQLQDTDSPQLKAVLTHSSSGVGSGTPFRVRFADETLRDTALRYWERRCAAGQSIIETRTVTRSRVPEQVFGNIGRWLDCLPEALCSAAKEEATLSSLCWNHPGLSPQELQDVLSEDTFMDSSLPFILSTTPQSQWGDLKTLLGTHRVPDQVGKSPHCWGQKLASRLPDLVLHSVLKRSRPKEYQLLLPSI